MSKSRAAIILKRIGTPTAREALDGFLAMTTDVGLKRYIDDAPGTP